MVLSLNSPFGLGEFKKKQTIVVVRESIELSIFRSIMMEGYWHLENSMEIVFVIFRILL